MASRTQATKRAFYQRSSGFTLAEALIASVVLSILVLGLGDEILASHQQTEQLQQTATAVALGRELLDEIVAKPLANPTTTLTTPTATKLTEARSLFVAVGDYNLYTDSGSALSMLGGTAVDATPGQTYTRTVTVKLGATPVGDSSSPSTDFAIVTVSVTDPAGATIKLSRVVSNYTFTR